MNPTLALIGKITTIALLGAGGVWAAATQWQSVKGQVIANQEAAAAHAQDDSDKHEQQDEFEDEVRDDLTRILIYQETQMRARGIPVPSQRQVDHYRGMRKKRGR